MGGDISKMAKQELVATIRDRYQQAYKKVPKQVLTSPIRSLTSQGSLGPQRNL